MTSPSEGSREDHGGGCAQSVCRAPAGVKSTQTSAALHGPLSWAAVLEMGSYTIKSQAPDSGVQEALGKRSLSPPPLHLLSCFLQTPILQVQEQTGLDLNPALQRPHCVASGKDVTPPGLSDYL